MGKVIIETFSVSGWLAIDDAAREIALNAFNQVKQTIPKDGEKLSAHRGSSQVVHENAGRLRLLFSAMQ